MDWPSKSPYMNPTEHLWDQMAVHISDMDNPPTRAAKSRVAVQQAWVAKRPVRLRTLVWSLPCWVRAVIAAAQVTPTINQPLTMPLILSTNLQNLKNFQCQLFLLWTLFIDTCYIGTPYTTAHWPHLPGNYSHWRCYYRISDFGCRNEFMCWNTVSIAGLRVSNATPPPAILLSVLTARFLPVHQNGLAVAVWYQTPGTTTSRLWAGRILHWDAYTWHLRIDITFFVWRKHERKHGGNMSLCTIYL